MSTKSLATRPFFALVGAGDLAVELARTATADVQARFVKVDLEPKVLRDQALTASEQARTQLEAYLTGAVTEVAETYDDLASRGATLLARIRGQQATEQAEAAARSTQARAKTAKTQTTRSAQDTAGTAKNAAKRTSQSAKRTGSTAKRTTKATATSAKKTAEAGTQAASEAAQKVGD